MTWAATFESLVAHYTALAMTPGWWQAAQHQVAEMEREQGGHWQGLRAEVGRRIKAARFRPAASDLTPFERAVSPLPQSRRGHGR